MCLLSLWHRAEADHLLSSPKVCIFATLGKRLGLQLAKVLLGLSQGKKFEQPLGSMKPTHQNKRKIALTITLTIASVLWFQHCDGFNFSQITVVVNDEQELAYGHISCWSNLTNGDIYFYLSKCYFSAINIMQTAIKAENGIEN